MRWEFNVNICTIIRTKVFFSILCIENICYLFKLGFRVPLYEMESENWGSLNHTIVILKLEFFTRSNPRICAIYEFHGKRKKKRRREKEARQWQQRSGREMCGVLGFL